MVMRRRFFQKKLIKIGSWCVYICGTAMKLPRSFCALGGFVFFFAVTALAAPVNDNFANAIPLTGLTVTTTGSNSGATRESGEPIHVTSSGTHSAWWRWTAPDR